MVRGAQRAAAEARLETRSQLNGIEDVVAAP